MDLQARYEAAADYLVVYLTLKAPNIFWLSSGLLRSTIRKAWNPDTNQWQVVIGGELAPYAVYTNEPWISPKWNGKENPNLYWVERALKEASPTLSLIMSGEASEQEINELIGYNMNIEYDAWQATAALTGGTV